MTLELVDLELPKPGFRQFISAWILEQGAQCFVVDPGPTASLERIYQALGDRRPTHLLLTHIHVDHAGGSGAMLERFPDAKVVVLDKAADHLVDPAQLVEGSKRTLGSLMDLYQEVLPVPVDSIIPASELSEKLPAVRAIPTPGHAAHHVSYLIGSALFCGEALGVRYELPNGDVYLRPATPKRFIASIYRESIAGLARLCREAEERGDPIKLCYAHYGSQSQALRYCEHARDQIELWIAEVTVLYEELGKELLMHSIRYVDTLIERMCERDPLFSLWFQLPEDVKERECIFINNTLDGIAAELARS